MLKIFFFSIMFLCYSFEKDIKFIKPINHLQSKNSLYIKNSKNSTSNLLKKNVILGVVVNYSLQTILPFFNSLIKAKFINCDFVIFVKNVTRLVRKYLKNIGVKIYNITNKHHVLPIEKYRWKLYMNFLNKSKNKYNLVFIADIRDTIFQSDIFQFYKINRSFLGIAIEDGTLNQDLNKKWLINFAGKKIQKEIKNERIICFGSMWGTIDKILDFTRIFWDKIKYNNNSTDQGIGNYLFYFEKLFQDRLIKSDNYGPVMTIGLTKRHNIMLDSCGNILNFAGELPAVVHQYDRKYDLVRKVNEKFIFHNYSFHKQKNISLFKNINITIKGHKFNHSKEFYLNDEIRINYKNIL